MRVYDVLIIIVNPHSPTTWSACLRFVYCVTRIPLAADDDTTTANLDQLNRQWLFWTLCQIGKQQIARSLACRHLLLD